MPAGLVRSEAASSVAPTPTPPIASCTGLKPIIRMPFVASAAAGARSDSAARSEAILGLRHGPFPFVGAPGVPERGR